jgi:hypothetical protein
LCTFRLRLPDDVIVEHVADFLRAGHFAFLATGERALGFLANDVVAKLDTFVADKNRWPGDQLAHLMLRLSAERAVKRALGVRTT